MSKNFKYDKNFDQVQRTSEEAERLLWVLDNDNASQDSLPDPIKRLEKSKTENNNSGKYPEGNPFGPILVLTLLIGVPMVIGALAESQNVQRYMNTNEIDFYMKTLKNAGDAVLKAEHESAIYGLNTLKNGKYREYRDVDQGLVNNKIIQAQNKIKYLDQPGKFKYWENSEYGSQWFDNSPDNQFKVFIAHSKKCKNPSIVFGFLNKENGPVLKRYTVRLKSTLSTVLVPMQLDGRQWIQVDKFNCN